MVISCFDAFGMFCVKTIAQLNALTKHMSCFGVMNFDSAKACATYSTSCLLINVLFLTNVQLNQLAFVVHMYH